jgi:hypothetical protein
MKAIFAKRTFPGFAVLLSFLAGCNPALQWREPPRAAHTKFVCEVRGASKSCISLTEVEFRDVTRRLQPPG